MTAIEKDRLRLKIFIGIHLTPELRIHLNKSILWKQAQIGSLENSLKEIQAHGKYYLGYHIRQEPIQFDLLKKLEAEIRNNLSSYCLDINTDRIPVQVFSQIFIE